MTMDRENADEVLALHDGYYCIVDGKIFGTWPCIEYARAGLETEKRRALNRRDPFYNNLRADITKWMEG